MARSQHTRSLLRGDDDDTFSVSDEKVIVPPKAKASKSTKTVEETVPAEPKALEAGRKYKMLEARTLSKKATEKLKDWHSANRGKAIAGFMGVLASAARKKYGNGAVFLGDEMDGMVLGIPCPSLAFEYLIAQDCYPLSVITQLVAKQGSGKSALLAEIGRWFDNYGGGDFVVENETKFNPFWYRSILRPEAYGRMQLRRSRSVEDWQRHVTDIITETKTYCTGTKDEPGPGKTVPILIGVDSIMGKMSEETQEKIVGSSNIRKASPGGDKKKSVKGEGYAQARQHPIEAGSITKYLRTLPQMLEGWPFAVVLINHLRENKDEQGNKVRHKGGGVGTDFQESFEIEIKKLGGHKKMIASGDFEGIPLQLSCEKSSLGPTHRKIDTRLLWWYEEDPNDPSEWQQVSQWDWDWSTVKLLKDTLDGNTSPLLKKALKEVLHLDCPKTSDIDNTAWSKTLGMTADDPLTWSEVGAMIRENAPLVKELRRCLRINSRPLLAPPDFGS